VEILTAGMVWRTNVHHHANRSNLPRYGRFSIYQNGGRPPSLNF